MTYYWNYDSPLGKICIGEDGTGISNLFFGEREIPTSWKQERTPLLDRGFEQIQEYLAGTRKTFDLPLSLHGTPFQMADWNALQQIPYGQTRTYEQIAQALKNPKACRAVGMANNRNPVAVLIPCHRVVGKNGSLVGYAGGLEIKEALLSLEQKMK